MFQGYKYKFKFNASHFIDLGKPETVHTHTFHIVLYVENRKNIFVSYYEIEKYISSILANYRGKCFNDIFPFNEIIPSLENICNVIYSEIDTYCQSLELDLVKIEISDNSVSWYALSEGLLIDSTNDIYSS